MTEASWIIVDAIGRAVEEYNLTHDEMVALLAHQIEAWTKQKLERTWGEV